MAWYHIYQFAEIDDPMYPQLKGKALPIIQYEIFESIKRIAAVKVKIKDGQIKWFDRRKCKVMLYKGGSDLLKLEQTHRVSLFKRLLKSLHMGV